MNGVWSDMVLNTLLQHKLLLIEIVGYIILNLVKLKCDCDDVEELYDDITVLNHSYLPKLARIESFQK